MKKILFISVLAFSSSVFAAQAEQEVKVENKEIAKQNQEEQVVKKYKNKSGKILITNQKLTEEQEKEFKFVKEIK